MALGIKEKPVELLRYGSGTVHDDGGDIKISIEATAAFGKIPRALKRGPKALSEPAFKVFWSLIKSESDPLRQTVLIRAIRAIDDVIEAASKSELKKALGQATDFEVITAALQSQNVLKLTNDPLMVAKLRGSQMKRMLLEKYKPLSSDEVAELLGISRQAVDKKRKSKGLLGLKIGREYQYPSIQFSDGEVLKGLKETLNSLKVIGDWTKFSFLVSEDSSLVGKSPIQALADGQVDKVKRLAQAYGEQTAA